MYDFLEKIEEYLPKIEETIENYYQENEIHNDTLISYVMNII